MYKVLLIVCLLLFTVSETQTTMKLFENDQRNEMISPRFPRTIITSYLKNRYKQLGKKYTVQ